MSHPFRIAAVLAVVATLGAQNESGPRGGLKLLERSQYEAIEQALIPLGGGLPPAVDLSAGMPPVRSQGSEESCTAWSAAYAIRTYLAHHGHSWDVSSPDHQFSPAFIYNQLVRGNCHTGLQFPEVLNLMVTQGVATLAAMPYLDGACSAQPGPQLVEQAAQYRIAGYRRINEQNPTEVKAQLAAQFPLLIAVEYDNLAQHLGPNQVWRQHGAAVGFHAVALVGYNDSNRTFKFMNSWGPNWGTGGYGLIDYDLFPRVVREAYLLAPYASMNPDSNRTSETKKSQNPKPNPQDVSSVTRPASQPQASVGVTGIAPSKDNSSLVVSLNYTLRGLAGHSGQIALHFLYPNGQGVRASGAKYADIYGYAAVGTSRFAISRQTVDNLGIRFTVPAAAFVVPSGSYVTQGGRRVYQVKWTNLLMRAELFVDNYGVARSPAFTFRVWR
jgi:hypothetical protein